MDSNGKPNQMKIEHITRGKPKYHELMNMTIVYFQPCLTILRVMIYDAPATDERTIADTSNQMKLELKPSKIAMQSMHDGCGLSQNLGSQSLIR